MTSWQGAWDMMSGKPSGEGTEADMLEAGYHFHALKGNGFLSPQRIADTALYLNSELASSVTGVTIPVDAGTCSFPGSRCPRSSSRTTLPPPGPAETEQD